MTDMLSGLRRFFTPPVFDDLRKTERVRMLYGIAIGTAILVTGVDVISSVFAPSLAVRLMVIAVAYDLASLALIFAGRRGWVNQASLAWLLVVWLIATATAWTGGGLNAPAISLQFIIVVLAGLLLGRRATLIAAVTAAFVMLGMGYAQVVGVLPAAAVRPAMFRAVTLAGYIAVLAVLSTIATRAAERLRARLDHELREREAQRRLQEKEMAIRQAYSDVIEAVTGGRLLLLLPDEIEKALGGAIEGERTIAAGGLGEAIEWLQGTLLSEFPQLTDPARLVDAAGEALANAVKHAGGGTYQLYRKEGVAQVRVSDHGPGIEFTGLSKAAFVPGYSTAGTLGHGFDVMLDRCDRVLLATQPGMTLLVLEVRTG